MPPMSSPVVNTVSSTTPSNTPDSRPTMALDRVDFGLHYGEIHAVVGENGAGKSTLIKIITGVIESDEGEIRANGIPVRIGTPHDATKLGITAVPQEVLLVPELPVGRNILLGMEGIFSRRTTLLP